MSHPPRLWLHSFPGSPSEERHSQVPWQPAADVCRVPGGWLVKLDVAGVRSEDFQITVSEQRLTIAGVRRDWQFESGSHYHSMEISYNRFQRTIEFPTPIEAAQITTDYRDGILFVRLHTESK